MGRLWRICFGGSRTARLTRILAAACAVAAVAALTAAVGVAVAGDSGARLIRALPHYAVPALVAGWMATAAAAVWLRLLARTTKLTAVAASTTIHLLEPPFLWLGAMLAGAWFEWQVRRTPIAYGSDWFFAEMYNEYVREPGGLVVSVSVAAAVTAPVAAVLAAWIVCACRPRRKKRGGPVKRPPAQSEG